MNRGYSDFAYIVGDVPVLGLDHFVHAHILREEPDYSISMLYGHKMIRLYPQLPHLYDHGLAILACITPFRNMRLPPISTLNKCTPFHLKRSC
jgi:hypothetical protein